MTPRRKPHDRDLVAQSNHGPIVSVASGVPGLDPVLGGGVPEYSFNLIAGGPGSGKTTLAQQIVYANASAEKPALYFTVLGEPTLKMLRYMQQYSFFDRSRVGTAVQYLNLSEEAMAQDLSAVFDRIVAEVARVQPSIVVVDSFRSLSDAARGAAAPNMGLEHFVQRLALQLTTWEVTSFLLGEYVDRGRRNPVFTVADGILWLSQAADRNSVVRKFQAVKMRGRAPMPGLHTFRITSQGLQIFPRIPEQQHRRPQATRRLSMGVPGLDALMAGGAPVGDAIMCGGPAGSGKTTFATQFVAEGLRNGESAIMVVFEEYPESYLARAASRNVQLKELTATDRLRIMYLRPLDLSVDETLAEIREAVATLGASRVVIDSLSGFEVALAPAFREDFRESLYRLVGALTATGVTVFMTTETLGGYPDPRITSERVSFITDDIIVQRFVEIDGELRKVLSVVKMRGSSHSTDFRFYTITANGAAVGGRVSDYRGIVTGVPQFAVPVVRPIYAGLTETEATVLNTLIQIGPSTSGQLAEHTALSVAEVDAVLGRFDALGYAVAADKSKGSYRAVARVGG